MLFMPSPRDIPDVKKLWHKLPYDKFIVKYKPQLESYTNGREFFLKHDEYTHLIICPDDLEIHGEGIEQLIEDVEKYDYQTISGICNIDESQMDTYAIQPLGSCNYKNNQVAVNYGAWYMKEKKPIIPENNIFEVGHSGFCCQIISRELMKKVSWRGATRTGINMEGNFDWQFSRDCNKLGVPIMVDKRVFGYHRRTEQYDKAKIVKTGKINGYSVWIKDR